MALNDGGDWFDTNAADILANIPGGGIIGGLDLSAGIVNGDTGQPVAPAIAGDRLEANRANAFRDAARAQGIRVDESDAAVLPRIQGWQPGQPLPASFTDGGGQRSASISDLQSPAPRAIQPYDKQFVAPTLEQATSSPGFQFRLGESLKALERRSSAGGTYNLPGTTKALIRDAGNLASDEYGKVFDRALTEYGTDLSRHRGNEEARFGSERSNRMDTFGIGDADRRFGEDARRFDSSERRDARDFAEGQRQTDFNIWHSQDNDDWNRQYSLAELGMRGAGLQGVAGNNYAAGAGDLVTGAGNARAAAQVAGSNAWNGALGGISSDLMTIDALRRRPKPATTYNYSDQLYGQG